MAKAGYTAPAGAAVALSPGVAKSVIGVSAPASFGVDWTKYRLAFDGVAATNTPVTVELCYATFATNAPGTNSTAITVQQVYGRVIAAGFTAAYSWTAEPTVLTPFDRFTVTPNGGTFVYDFPLGTTPDSAVSQGFVIRLTAANAVNVNPSLWFERC